MYYVYIIGSVIVSLILIGVACSAPIFILKEFDKMTYIKGYRKNLKWYKLPILLLLKISAFLFLIVSGVYIYFVLYIPESNLDEIIFGYYFIAAFVTKRLGIQKFQMVERIAIATPLVGIGITYALVNGITAALYYFELHAISQVFNVICNVLPYVLISYYMVLIARQFMHLLYVEKKQLLDQYSDFWSKDKKTTIKQILLSDSAKKYKREYLQLYNTEQEWENGEFNTLYYNYFSLQLFKLFSIVTLINCLLFFIVGTIYDAGNYRFLQANLGMRTCVIITGSVITILCLNWLFNMDIILSFKNKIKITKKSFTLFFLSVIIGILSIGSQIIYMVHNSYKYVSGYEYNYQEFKSSFVRKVEVNRDYLNYNDYEKVDYIFRYPNHFVDDAETLNYEYNFFDGSFFMIVPVENSDVIDSANRYYGEDLNYYILVDNFIREYTSLGVKTSSDDNEDSFMVLDKYDLFRVNINEANRQDNDSEFKTEEEAELGLLVKEEALKATNSLWDEEMKDRGLI